MNVFSEWNLVDECDINRHIQLESTSGRNFSSSTALAIAVCTPLVGCNLQGNIYEVLSKDETYAKIFKIWT